MTAFDPLTFTVNPLDRAGNERADPDWIAARAADPAARAMLFWRGRPLLDGARIAWLEMGALDWLPRDGEPVFLGLDAGAPRFAATLDPSLEAPDPGVEGAFEDARMTAWRLGHAEAGMLGHGRSLLEWRARHTACSACGAATRQAEGGAKRVCEACEAEHFPRCDPVAIVWITRGDRALLGRQGYWPAGIFSALAGFIEPGETIEAGAAREALEESGIRIADIAYVESQPWPFPSSLMIGLRATAETEDIVIDPQELEAARWFPRAAVAAALEGRGGDLVMPPTAAIARRLAERWIAGEWD